MSHPPSSTQSSNLNHRTKILQIFYQKHTNTTKGFISNSESSSSHHRRRSSIHNAIIDIIDEQGPPAGAGGLYPSTYQSRSRYIIYQLVCIVCILQLVVAHNTTITVCFPHESGRPAPTIRFSCAEFVKNNTYYYYYQEYIHHVYIRIDPYKIIY